MRTRRGTTLIELLVVIAGCAALLSLSSQVLHRALRMQSESRGYFDGEQTAWRLAEDFRRDVHAASAAAAGDQALLRLELPEGAVVYERERGSIVRKLTRPDGQQAQETYPMPSGTAVQATIDEKTRLVTLLLEAEEPPPGVAPPTRINEAPHYLEAAAQWGRDRRFRTANREGSTP